MTSQLNYDEMYHDPTNRSTPAGNSNRPYPNIGGGGGGQRAVSSNFDPYAQQQQGQGYLQNEYAAMRYDAQRPDRLPQPQTLYQAPAFNAYDGAQTWSNNPSAAFSSTMGPPSRNRAQARRGALPATWLDQPQQQNAPYPSLQTQQPMQGMPNGHQPSMYHASQLAQPQRQDRQGSSTEDSASEELIPTAIVIKNIPFAIKREQLTDVMSEMHLPLPYAFNYHFDNGVFRGLAFANFSSPEETAAVIDAMNHMELQGRKLRVEYKKMLPLQERERIEREKRERRGQLEEQHRPMQMGVHNSASISSLSSALPATSPSPVSMRGQQETKIDMNDATTLDYYGRLVVFKDDETRRMFVVEPPVPATYRRVLHELAHKLGLEHESAGTGDMRHVQIFKDKRSNPLSMGSGLLYNDTSRRGLARAATMDFNESRDPLYHTLRNATSALLDVPSSPGTLTGAPRSLREAKSFGDLQARTSSPALSSSSFPANLSHNAARYADYQNAQLPPRDDYLPAAFSNLALGYERGGTAPRIPTAGAIGSQRSSHGLSTYEDVQRGGAAGGGAVERQPRGPGSEWGAGFARARTNGHASRGSGELDLGEVEAETRQQQQQLDGGGGGGGVSLLRYDVSS
ncbi:hypothetical protein VE01_07675 [Pseudogymnoascus verrucosus]|uniref:RRM domain-containing protein n=1 Tax=Pseudogymnoascus verrucosus TaxID=342668 RepID=A0A1B8GEV6_9PEZI|nr:uncharacterized protein VE01_07675 [Pseudogymnoascus verrucosus]OBT94366.2 hypothetical protein VE01_07675 [Pseudogymnoascus verrucosus]